MRVTADVRQQIENVLLEGESLSQFVERAAVDAARRRQAQQEFIARGRASLARARETGELHDADQALEAMRSRMAARLSKANAAGKTPTRR
nr:YlcI/YnfO family protein [Pseudacidovorax intermedius]